MLDVIVVIQLDGAKTRRLHDFIDAHHGSLLSRIIADDHNNDHESMITSTNN